MLWSPEVILPVLFILQKHTLPLQISLPQQFLEAGYTTIGIGKLFHPGAVSGNDDRNHSWTDQRYYHGVQTAAIQPHQPGWWSVNASDDALVDGDLASRAEAALRNLSKTSDPFFLGVGFHKVMKMLLLLLLLLLVLTSLLLAAHARILPIQVLRSVQRFDPQCAESGLSQQRAAHRSPDKSHVSQLAEPQRHHGRSL